MCDELWDEPFRISNSNHVRREKGGWWGGNLDLAAARMCLAANYLRLPAYLRGREAPSMKKCAKDSGPSHLRRAIRKSAFPPCLTFILFFVIGKGNNVRTI